jgi:CRP/FNR family cyclic AMP-dependent transcriptional regulator
MSEKIWYLKQCELFEKLNDSQIQQLERVAQSKSFSRKSVLYFPNDSADSILLVASGRVKICNITPEGKQSILAFIEPGEIFGELSVFAAAQREEYAETMEKSTIIKIPVAAIQTLINELPNIALGITKLMGFRRLRIERRLKHLLFRSTRDRLVHLLLELMDDYGQQHQDGVLLNIKLSHQDLASIIGSTRESVTMVLGDLQLEKLIQIEKRKIMILNPKSLADSAEIDISKSKTVDSPTYSQTAPKYS